MGVCVGVDVAKARLDWVLGPQGEVERCPNTPAGVRRLVKRLGQLDLDRVVQLLASTSATSPCWTAGPSMGSVRARNT